MKIIMDDLKIKRTIKRITHEILEQNINLNSIVLVGIHSNGIPFAKLLQNNIKIFEDIDIPLEQLDISTYRDDIKIENKKNVFSTDIVDKNIILVDDVLYTGRTIRAAMDAILDLGRPKSIQLAVLIDRGHRELPISPKFVGKNVPTSKQELVEISFINEMFAVIK